MYTLPSSPLLSPLIFSTLRRSTSCLSDLDRISCLSPKNVGLGLLAAEVFTAAFGSYLTITSATILSCTQRIPARVYWTPKQQVMCMRFQYSMAFPTCRSVYFVYSGRLADLKLTTARLHRGFHCRFLQLSADSQLNYL
jgi:hypothetical protein